MDERERPALVAGAQQLGEALAAASGLDWPIQLRFWSLGGGLTASPPGGVIILSLMPEVEREEPFAETEARWRARLSALVQTVAPVMLCTVFRCLPDRRAPSGPRRLERIRRLNRMAADLSQALGVGVIDIDRAFAHIGGRILATDYRLQGRLAAEVAGHTLVWSLLSFGLDDAVPPDVQEKAKAFHGPLREIDTLVRRRLSRV